jgi:alpha-L-arabinofuranosidase
LNEIEYIIGDVHTYWGAKRAADGHPAPFKLRYVEIGNEDGFRRHREVTMGVSRSLMMLLRLNIQL